MHNDDYASRPNIVCFLSRFDLWVGFVQVFISKSHKTPITIIIVVSIIHLDLISNCHMVYSFSHRCGLGGHV